MFLPVASSVVALLAVLPCGFATNTAPQDDKSVKDAYSFKTRAADSAGQMWEELQLDKERDLRGGKKKKKSKSKSKSKSESKSKSKSKSKSESESYDKQTNENTFDYIVVGSGAGGGTVAARLAQAGYDTLLLESGPDYDSVYTQLPAWWPKATIAPEVEWAFRVKMMDGIEDVLYPRSSNLGGSSLHNAMQTAYSFWNTFSNLELLTGDENFKEKDMRARFQRIERNEYIDPDSELADGHGYEGYFSTSHIDEGYYEMFANDVQLVTLVNAVADAYPARKSVRLSDEFPILPDINALGMNQEEGAHQTPAAISPERGFRRSSVYDLIKDAEANMAETLTIMTRAYVSKIHFKSRKGKDPTAYGVHVMNGQGLFGAASGQYKLDGEMDYYARKEVIVAAGTFNTPHLLMNSGIGPAKELRKHGIDVVTDLPGVGRNMQDKMEYTIGFQMKENWVYQNRDDCRWMPASLDDPCLRDFLNGVSPGDAAPYALPAGVIAMQGKSSEDLRGPDLYAVVSPAIYFDYYKSGWVEDTISGGPEQASPPLSIFVIALANHKGSVTLKSADPLEPPEIDMNCCRDDDLDRFAPWIDSIRETIHSTGYAKHEVNPGAEYQGDDLKEAIKPGIYGHHACCTAKIGADNDEMAVLDGQFRVRGVNNLRVVDLSSFPSMPGLFPMLPIMMLGEKAAEDIIRDA